MSLHVHLKLACAPFAPVRHPCSIQSKLAVTKDCRNPGNEAEIVQAILAGAGFSYELLPIPKELMEKFGFMRGLYAFLDSGLVDGACQVFSITDERRARFQPSAVLTSFESFMGTTLPKEATFGSFTNWFQFLTIFDWRLIVACFMLFVWSKLFEMKILRKSFVDVQERFYGKLLGTWSFTYAFIGVTFGLFLGLYTSSILSNILIPPSTETFRNLDELTGLIERGEINVYTSKNTGWLQRLRSVQNCSIETCRFKEALKKHPIIELDGAMAKTVNLSFKQGGTVLYSSASLEYLSRYYCEMTLVTLNEMQAASSKSVMLFNRNTSSSIIKRINESLMKNQNILSTISNKYRKISQGKSAKCARYGQKTSNAYTIQFREIIGVLIFSAGGCFAAILVLVAECHSKSAFKQKSHR